MSTLHIRDARPDETETVLAVTLSAYEQYAPVMEQESWQIYRNNIVITVGNSAPAEQIIALQDDKIVGTVLLYPAKTVTQRPNGEALIFKWPEIRLLAVAPSARGQGVGAALMQECIERARKAGDSSITLHTTDMMDVAQRMYIRMGFQRDADLDFSPAPNFTIKGFRFDLDKSTV